MAFLGGRLEAILFGQCWVRTRLNFCGTPQPPPHSPQHRPRPRVGFPRLATCGSRGLRGGLGEPGRAHPDLARRIPPQGSGLQGAVQHDGRVARGPHQLRSLNPPHMAQSGTPGRGQGRGGVGVQWGVALKMKTAWTLTCLNDLRYEIPLSNQLWSDWAERAGVQN